MSEWQKIESAPKDGTEVLLFARRKSFVYIGYYSVHAQKSEEGWVISDLSARSPEFCPWQPTHWMPLPEPPKP